ncbi:MAG: hypothetical protein JSV45_12010 [Chromatiales bacterium]|nr:MAG: hypothetical protein JSV45_12010 [Chromatiales bacterium]
MNGQPKDTDQAEDKDFEDTEQLSLKAAKETDNVGDASVEINLEELLVEVEAAGLSTEHYEEAAARKKLDEVLEEKRTSKEVSDFEDFDID